MVYELFSINFIHGFQLMTPTQLSFSRHQSIIILNLSFLLSDEWVIIEFFYFLLINVILLFWGHYLINYTTNSYYTNSFHNDFYISSVLALSYASNSSFKFFNNWNSFLCISTKSPTSFINNSSVWSFPFNEAVLPMAFVSEL